MKLSTVSIYNNNFYDKLFKYLVIELGQHFSVCKTNEIIQFRKILCFSAEICYFGSVFCRLCINEIDFLVENNTVNNVLRPQVF